MVATTHGREDGMSLRGTLIKRVLYPLNERREGKQTLPHLHALEESQYDAPERRNEKRWRALRAILQQAYAQTPFYRERFREAGITPDNIKDWDDLRKLRPLTKADLQQRLDDLIARNVPESARHRSATGGSTGQHTPFYRDNACLDPKMAGQLRFNRWAGWDVGEPLAFVWVALQDFAKPPTSRARLRNWLIDRQLSLCAGSLNEGVLEIYARKLRRFRPVLIRAFPSPLAVLAGYLKNTTNSDIRPRGIITVGEPLLDTQRRLFEEVFACPVFNCYVSRECGNMASECEQHDGLHIADELLHIEFERDGKPAAPGEIGNILVTDLANRGMPLLRYEIGDMGSPRAGSCPCGRTLPMMAMEAGRVTDFLVSPIDGTLISGASLCHYLVAEGPDVGQIQIVQDAQNHLTVRIVRGSRFREEDLRHFEQVVQRLFHAAMQVTFSFVDSIPREPGGKYRFCVNQWRRY
jgi:phenylacetate-CoA ligase